MLLKNRITLLAFGTGILILFLSFFPNQDLSNDNILSYSVDLEKQNLEFFWQDEGGEVLQSFKNLKSYLDRQNEELIFAMNGGMYLKDKSPQGLFIQDSKILKNIDSIQKGYGNFYMQPNGIFYITTENTGQICSTDKFSKSNVCFATQSGPMLLIDGKIHARFREGSENLNIRNGVGILPNGQVLFAMSKQEINFFDFASYFKSMGCKQALYLDGFISKTYLPHKNYTTLEGNFGVIIAETKLKSK